MNLRAPIITPLRDASWGFGLWPWSKGPLWRLEERWEFGVGEAGRQEMFVIPAGYEFDKASIPSVFWGPPFAYTPDGLCTVPALEHDFLCDLYHGGSPWLKQQLGIVPAAPPVADIHMHFYTQLVAWGVRASKAELMYAAVRNFGPGGRAWPKNWFHLLPLMGVALLAGGCTQDVAGLSRGDRLQIYGAALDLAGHPEIGVPVAALGQRLEKRDAKQPRKGVQP